MVTLGQLISFKLQQEKKETERAKQLIETQERIVQEQEKERREREAQMQAIVAYKEQVAKEKLQKQLRRNAIDERDKLVMFIVKNSQTRTRKNGTRYIQANPNRKESVRSAQRRVNMINKTYFHNRPGYPDQVRKEIDSLAQQRNELLERTGETRETERMLERLVMLTNVLRNMNSNSYVKRTGRHYYQRVQTR
jgi:hypothetical protein